MLLRTYYERIKVKMSMNNLKLITTENFEDVAPCDFWADINDEYFLTREQIGRALGYNNPTNAIKNIHLKHKERLDKFSTTVTLGMMEGNRFVKRKRLIYNLQGIMFIIQSAQVKKELKEKLLVEIQDKIGNRELIVITERKELSFVNDLEEFLSAFNIKGIAQYKIDDKYRIDYYIPDLKIAIEYDENSHKNYNKNEEKIREEYINSKLGCKFIRVSDDNSDIKNIGIVAKELYNYAQPNI